MRGIKAAVPRYDESEAHIVRRLGWAIVEQWDNLPKAVRENLIEQAISINDQYETVELKQQIEAFVRKYANGDQGD